MIQLKIHDGERQVRTRVTDGDLVLVRIPEEWTQATGKQFETTIGQWFKAKGLTNCQVMMVTSNDKHYEFEVLSVNDVFEQEVLG